MPIHTFVPSFGDQYVFERQQVEYAQETPEITPLAHFPIAHRHRGSDIRLAVLRSGRPASLHPHTDPDKESRILRA